jgi:hypothetical protein
MKMYIDSTGDTVTNRKAYIVGIAAGDPSVDSELGMYIDETVSGPSTTFTSSLIGTRLDTTDPDYASSSFSLDICGSFDLVEADIWMKGSVDGFIKKNSGGEPFCYFRTSIGYNGGYQESQTLSDFGSLAATTNKVALAPSPSPNGLSAVEIERVDSSSELCFRLIIGSGASRADCGVKLAMRGSMNYTGTLITSSNGTEF